MCLAIPAQITKIFDNARAEIDLGGIRREISTVLLQDIAIGDYVILHAGYALTRLDEQEAQKTLQLFREMLPEMAEFPPQHPAENHPPEVKP